MQISQHRAPTGQAKQSFDMRDVKQLTAAAEHVNHLLQNGHRGRGVRARFHGKDPVTGWGQDFDGRIIAVGTLFTDGEFAVTFLVDTPRRLCTVGGHDAIREDVAAERLDLLG